MPPRSVRGQPASGDDADPAWLSVQTTRARCDDGNLKAIVGTAITRHRDGAIPQVRRHWKQNRSSEGSQVRFRTPARPAGASTGGGWRSSKGRAVSVGLGQ